MIKYRYAYNSDGQIVCIDSIVRQIGKHKEKYYCLCCEKELIPRLGNIKQHHFKHKEPVTCSGESYLHILGKKVFYNEFKYCLENKKPFFIELYQQRICNSHQCELNIICHLGKSLEKFNLLDHFIDIFIEKREGSFIPDVMLISKNGKDKLFVEIAVTHLCSEQKLYSNYRIIELIIKEDDDLDIIKTHFLSEEQSSVKFINFNTREVINKFCRNHCKKYYHMFVVTSEGRCKLFHNTLTQFSSYLQRMKDRVNYFSITKYNDCYSLKFKVSIAKAHKDNVNVKNCFLCRYHGDNRSYDWIDALEKEGKPIFCKFLKVECNSNHASLCAYYRPDNKYIEELFEYSHSLIEKADLIEPNHKSYFNENLTVVD